MTTIADIRAEHARVMALRATARDLYDRMIAIHTSICDDQAKGVVLADDDPRFDKLYTLDTSAQYAGIRSDEASDAFVLLVGEFLASI